MYPIPKSEKLIETRQCRHCQTDFPITDKDFEFYDKVSPTFAGVKCQIPAPTLCPDCRQQRRLTWRNERKFYKRKCDATGRDMISTYSPDKPYKVFHQDFWWSDNWSPLNYGRDFDFSKSFFKQWWELLRQVPLPGLLQRNGENSEYTSDSEGNKNCYLCSTSWENEDCLYAANIFWAKDCVDGFWIVQSEHCYDCVSVEASSNLSFCSFCSHCSFGILLEDCENTQNSICCIGLRNQKYHFLNRPVALGEYNLIRARFFSDEKFRNECREKFEALRLSIPHRSGIHKSTQNVSGEYLSDVKDAIYCFDVINCENIRYSFQANRLQDAADMTITGANETHSRLYEWVSVPASDSAYFNITVWESHDVFYNYLCYSSSHLFGCIGLRNKEYCIFNKQYSREEYETLVPRIVTHMKTNGEWGEFFPSILSPFGYNETVANEYFPLDRNVAIPGRFAWSDFEPPFPAVSKIIPAAKLPSDIAAVPDDILNWAIECEVTGKPFKIIKQELEFYRKHGLPIPRRHPDQRHLDRMSLRNPRKLYEHDCDKCWKKMITTYTPDRPEKVYCEECYRTVG